MAIICVNNNVNCPAWRMSYMSNSSTKEVRSRREGLYITGEEKDNTSVLTFYCKRTQDLSKIMVCPQDKEEAGLRQCGHFPKV